MALPTQPDGHDIVVVGASAGGVEALKTLVRELPASLPAAVLIVLHVSPTGASVLPGILGRAGRLAAAHAVDGERIVRGRIYVAPPDHHMLVEDDRIRVTRGPRENGHRPAVDPLFRTAAESHGAHVLGIILSGALDDGSAGLAVIRAHGGVAIVQDPGEALSPGMPSSAIVHASPEHVLPVAKIGRLVAELAGGAPARPREPVAQAPRPKGWRAGAEPLPKGVVSDFTCPDCGGTLWESEQGNLVSFRCRVGHAFSVESLYDGKRDVLESALWASVRAFEEQAGLARRLATQMLASGDERLAETYELQAREAEHRGTLVQEVTARAYELTQQVAPPGMGVEPA